MILIHKKNKLELNSFSKINYNLLLKTVTYYAHSIECKTNLIISAKNQINTAC